ncbi:MAG: CoA pyrophosphatase [Bacteroidia bacterium]|nr:CoA pyrophosphatase [Bacteroidia bacterium]
MSPLKRLSSNQYRKNYPQKGAVLILIYPQSGCLQTVAMLRPDYGGPHSGQVSFPGGKYEESDGSLENTALRETSEELGLDTKNIEVLGGLTDLYIPISNFNVYPFLAVMDSAPVFLPDTKEVKRVIKIPLSDILNNANIKRKPIMMALIGKEIEMPYFDLQGETIWGATAMMLSELKELLKPIARIL